MSISEETLILAKKHTNRLIGEIASNKSEATDGKVLTANGDGTSTFKPLPNSDLIAFSDTSGNIVATNVEGALTELATNKVSKVPSANPGNIIIAGEDGSMIDSGYPIKSTVDSWADVQSIVRLGVAPTVFSIGDQLQCNRGSDVLTWDIVGFDQETPVDVTKTHSMTLLMHDCYKMIQFDGVEALYYAETELSAGTYNFTLLAGYDAAYGGGLTYYFTLTKPVPAGGQIYFPWGYNIQASDTKISTYASKTATATIETNISVTAGTDGIALTPTNHSHRIRYGSNNWQESAIRQWLNSNAAAGSVWIPTNNYDRPPTWVTTESGFLNGIDADFLSVIGDVTKRTAKNTITDGGGYTDLTEKFFLPSKGEVGGNNENNINEGDPYSYYDDMLINHTRSETEIAGRIKYLSGTARIWWLRSPHSSSANSVRRVHTSGSVITNYASNAYGAAPACVVI